MQPSWSPDGRWIAATKTSTLGTDVVDPRRPQRQRGPAPDQRRPIVGAGLVAEGRHDRVHAHRGPDRRPQADRARAATAPTWTAEQLPDVTQYSGLDGGSRRELVHPARPAPAAAARADRPGGQPERLVGSVTAGYLERLAARSAATGTVLCVGLDPDPGRPPAGLRRPTSHGIEAFCRLILEASLPSAAAVKANLAFFEAFGPDGIAALERLRGVGPGRRAVRRRREARRHRLDRRAPGGRPVRPARRRRDHRQPVPRVGGDRAAPRASRSVRLRPVPDVEPGRRRAPGPRRVRADDDAPAEPLYLRVARRAGGWGPGGTVGLVVGATAPEEMARIRATAPGPGFLVPGRRGPGRRGRAGPPRWPGDRAAGRSDRRRRAARQRLAGHRRRRGGTPRQRRPADPGEALAEAARDWAKRLPVLL